MLSDEGNGNGEKTTIGLINKKQLCTCSTLFFVHFFAVNCFARLQRETSRNFLVTRFMEEMSYVFLFNLFSLSLIFTLVTASISHFPTAATKFHVVPPKKNVSFVFSISL